jgi:hypothetical protein
MGLLREKVVVDQCDKLIDLQVWPPSKIDPFGWLDNFRGRDRELAVHMLGHFMFYSDHLVDALFMSAFHNLSNLIRIKSADRLTADRDWNSFLSSVIVTPMHGEEANPSDSGYGFARKARQVWGIDEWQLVAPDEALRLAMEDPDRPIVFVDDFVGSGEQFRGTWLRRYRRLSATGSFSKLSRDYPHRAIYYCNAIMTHQGYGRISSRFPRVTLSTGNIIPERYSFAHERSDMWPSDVRVEGISFIESASKSIGFLDTGGDEDDWRGFHELGLGLAFEHSTPDATLPIFFHEASGWIPLVRRR